MSIPRSYLVCTLPYSLNPEIALQMNELAGFDEKDRVLDPCCGAGTILIERQLTKPCYCLGADIYPKALECAEKNIAAANVPVELKHGNIMEQKFPDGYFTKIISNLPYGIHTGSREENLKLYNFLAEACQKWLKKGGKAVFMTTTKKILWNAFADKQDLKFVSETPLKIRGLTPSIYVFEKV